MKYIDIHNHIIPAIDDGAKSVEEAIQMLKAAERANIDKIITTPHYREEYYLNTKEVIEAEIKTLKALIKSHKLNIDIYPGSEVYLTKSTAEGLNNGVIQTLNNSSYVLIEFFPYSDYWRFNVLDELYNLTLDGYKVIIAHPERYDITHRNPNFIYDLVNAGYYIQVNVNSLKSNHPNHKLTLKLLDHNLVHFIASDAHDLINRPLSLHEGYEYVKTHYNEDYANTLFNDNPLKVIENKMIDSSNFRKIKKFFIFSK